MREASESDPAAALRFLRRWADMERSIGERGSASPRDTLSMLVGAGGSDERCFTHVVLSKEFTTSCSCCVGRNKFLNFVSDEARILGTQSMENHPINGFIKTKTLTQTSMYVLV